MATALRYGLIGAGMMGREHVRNLALIPGSQITAFSDPDAQSRAETAAVVGEDAKAYADHRDLIASGLVDALVIASPNDTHTGILSDIFSAPKALPVLVEKPVCTRAQVCEMLAQQAMRHSAPVWVAMEYRYMAPVTELVTSVRSGIIGDLKMLSIREHRYPFLKKVGDWNRFNARTGGTLVEKCCHFFDLMRLVTQDEAIRVYASGGADVNHRDEQYDGSVPDIIDNAYAIVDFRSGKRALLDLCMFAEGSFWQESIAATGDRGKVECFVPGPARFWQNGDERHSEIEFSPRHPQNPQRRAIHVDEAVLKAGDHHGSTYFQHQKFRDAVLGNGDVEVSMDDGLKAVIIGLAAEESVRRKAAVSINGWTLA